MKVGIVTIVSLNFGNRLQNYALQRVLENLGCTVHTFRRTRLSKGIKYWTKALVQTSLQTKGAKFREFDKKIHFSDVVIGRDNCPDNLEQKYDYFIAGSDQIWNPYYDFVAGKCDFLGFARKEQKISYAASFGVSEIPPERKEEYEKYLKTFKAISVRENQGAKIIEDLISRKATIVLDPTLMLDESEWKNIEKNSHYCPKHAYVFVYALGDKNDRFKIKIEQLQKNYEIFDVCAIQKNGRELPIGPSEFLNLLRNAEIILTDSFHATAFSILYQKKFITFNRPGLNMNSRIKSLAELIGERDRLNKYGDLDCEIDIDYKKIDTILKKERKKSIDFLNMALNE